MMYNNWAIYHDDDTSYFEASIEKIDKVLSDDPRIWCLDKTQRAIRGTDWKPNRVEKISMWIERQKQIEPPEFYFDNIDQKIKIMDGRHRIYAFYAAGYETILVRCIIIHKDYIYKVIGVEN